MPSRGACNLAKMRPSVMRGHGVPDAEKKVIKDAKTKHDDTVDHRVDWYD